MSTIPSARGTPCSTHKIVTVIFAALLLVGCKNAIPKVSSDMQPSTSLPPPSTSVTISAGTSGLATSSKVNANYSIHFMNGGQTAGVNANALPGPVEVLRNAK